MAGAMRNILYCYVSDGFAIYLPYGKIRRRETLRFAPEISGNSERF